MTISVIGHAAVLLWGLVSFTAKPLNAAPPESLPVDIISATEFSQLTKGTRTAPQMPAPKPLVERVAEAKPVEDPTPKVVEKPEITPTADQVQPPTPPEPQVVKPKPKPPTPQAKPEPKQRDAFAPEPKPDPIADTIRREQQKKPEPPKTVTPPPQKKVEPVKPQPKYDPSRIAALLDKRDPQRRAATGDIVNTTPALGTPAGAAPTLSQTELDALRARLADCWRVPVGVTEARDLQVVVRILFNRDGSLSAEPRLMNHGSHPAFQVAAESALRAVRTCAPYTFLPVAKYEAWKDVEVTFDPRDMFRG